MVTTDKKLLWPWWTSLSDQLKEKPFLWIWNTTWVSSVNQTIWLKPKQIAPDVSVMQWTSWSKLSTTLPKETQPWLTWTQQAISDVTWKTPEWLQPKIWEAYSITKDTVTTQPQITKPKWDRDYAPPADQAWNYDLTWTKWEWMQTQQPWMEMPTDTLSYAQQKLREEQQWLVKEQEILATKEQGDYMQKVKEQEEYLRSQQDKKKQIDTLSWQISDIQSSQRIRNAATQLDKLKSNIAYLWTMWKPGVSAVRLDAVANQIKEAEQTFSELKQVEANMKQIQELWIKFDAEQFEMKMQWLQDDLDNNVNKVIQDALNWLSSAEMEWKLDTVEEVNNLRLQVLDSIDRSVEWITNKNIQLRQQLISEYQSIVEDQKQYIAQSQKVNNEMSQAQWYYVDWNWNPILSQSTWQPIRLPQEAPLDPIFDKSTWQLIQFATDENWQIVANVNQILDKPTFEQQTIVSYANLVAQWKINFNDVPEQIRNTDSFAQQLWQTEFTQWQQWVEWMTPYQMATLWSQTFEVNWVRYQYNPETMQYSAITPTWWAWVTTWWWWVWTTWWLSQTPATPSWNIQTSFLPTTSSAWWINVKMDAVAMPSITNALNKMKESWVSPIINQSTWTYRTTEQQEELKNTVSWRVADPNLSLHTKWLAVDMYWGTDAQWRLMPPTAEQVQIMKENWFIQPYPKDDAWHFEYVWSQWTYNIDTAKAELLTRPEFKDYTQTDRKNIVDQIWNIAQNEWITVDQAISKYFPNLASKKQENISDDQITSLLDLTPEQNEAFSYVKSQLPTKDKDSDADKLSIAQFTIQQMKKWLDIYQIADIYKWFKIKEDDSFWVNIRNLIWTTESFDNMWEIWRLHNQGKDDQVLRILYNNAETKAKQLYWEDYVSSSFARQATSQVNEILNFIDEKWMKDIWAFNWTLQNYLTSKFKTKEAQQIQSDLLNITATLTTKLSWTAKTESELKFINDLIPNIWDNADNFIIKLNNLKELPLMQYNSQMVEWFWFKPLNEEQLLDFNTRLSSYRYTDQDISDFQAYFQWWQWPVTNQVPQQQYWPVTWPEITPSKTYNQWQIQTNYNQIPESDWNDFFNQ